MLGRHKNTPWKNIAQRQLVSETYHKLLHIRRKKTRTCNFSKYVEVASKNRKWCLTSYTTRKCRLNSSKTFLRDTLAISRADEDGAQQECSCTDGWYKKNAAFSLEDNLTVCNKAIGTLEHSLYYIFLLWFLRWSDNMYLQQNYAVLETVLFMFPLLSNKHNFH